MSSSITIEFMQQGVTQEEFGIIVRTDDGSPITEDHGQMILDAMADILMQEGFLFRPRNLQELDS